MQHTHREMHSLEEALVEDYMEEEEDGLYGGQEVKTLEEEHKTIEENKN